MLKKAAIFGLAGVMAVAAGCGSNKMQVMQIIMKRKSHC